MEELLYYPFGEIMLDSSPTKVRYKFAGHEFDADTELIYMGARYYDPKLARFVSPDPVVPVRVELHNYRDFKMTQFRQLTNPQAFNRYSYVVNNPIVFRDPFGLDKVSSRLGQVSYVLNTAGLALAPSPLGPTVGVVVKVSGVVVSGTAIAYSAVQLYRGKMESTEAWINIGLSLGDILGFAAEKLGYEATGKLIGGMARGAETGVAAVDSAKVLGESKTPGPNPANAIEVNNPAKTTTENIDNKATGSTPQAVQAPAESSRKPGSTETEFVPMNFLNFSNPAGQSGGSWSMFSVPINGGSSGAGGGAGFISPPAAGYNPGN